MSANALTHVAPHSPPTPEGQSRVQAILTASVDLRHATETVDADYEILDPDHVLVATVRRELPLWEARLDSPVIERVRAALDRVDSEGAHGAPLHELHQAYREAVIQAAQRAPSLRRH
jgi:hypothetical protein